MRDLYKNIKYNTIEDEDQILEHQDDSSNRGSRTRKAGAKYVTNTCVCRDSRISERLIACHCAGICKLGERQKVDIPVVNGHKYFHVTCLFNRKVLTRAESEKLKTIESAFICPACINIAPSWMISSL